MKKLVIVGLAIYLFLLIFSRFYNLEYTARFTEDESGFLVSLHQIYVDKKLTLIGQVNEMGTKVFSSLSIYLLLPFAVLGKFNPASVFYGAAFWGVATALVMLYLSKVVNNKILFLSALLILLWFPLLQTGRWAWNPNFIPFWISLGLLFYLQKKRWFYLLTGLSFGLSIHHHYYAIFAVSIFTIITSLEALKNRQFINAFLVNLGVALTLLPFVIFDLRHPPGLFIMGASNQAQNLALGEILNNIWNFLGEVLRYYAQSAILFPLLVLELILLLIFDIKKKGRSLIFLLPCLGQIIFIAILGVFYQHYFFAMLPFFFIWVIYPRETKGFLLSFLIILTLIIGSIAPFVRLLTTAPVEPDLATVNNISSLLKNQIKSNDLKNVNIAVLSSPDKNTNGRKYRDILLVPENLHPLSKDEYHFTDHLFVISTAAEDKLRSDPATELNRFRFGPLRAKWQIDDSPWFVYHLLRNPDETAK